MTPPREQKIDDLRLRNFADNSISNYVRAVRQYADLFGRSPDQPRYQSMLRWMLTLVLAIETQIDGYATILDVDTAVAETMDRLAAFVEAVPESLKRG